jgi:hypothetical protein
MKRYAIRVKRGYDRWAVLLGSGPVPVSSPFPARCADCGAHYVVESRFLVPEHRRGLARMAEQRTGQPESAFLAEIEQSGLPIPAEAVDLLVMEESKPDPQALRYLGVDGPFVSRSDRLASWIWGALIGLTLVGLPFAIWFAFR